jgi:hypothetical protein
LDARHGDRVRSDRRLARCASGRLLARPSSRVASSSGATKDPSAGAPQPRSGSPEVARGFGSNKKRKPQLGRGAFTRGLARSEQGGRPKAASLPSRNERADAFDPIVLAEIGPPPTIAKSVPLAGASISASVQPFGLRAMSRSARRCSGSVSPLHVPHRLGTRPRTGVTQPAAFR